jgi:hypothetical protein
MNWSRLGETADLFDGGLDEFQDEALADDDLFASDPMPGEDEDDDLDWLSDMAAIQTGELVIDEVPSAETAVPEPGRT